MSQQYLADPVLLDLPIISLSIVLQTGDAAHAGSDDEVYCNVVFADGSLLFACENFELDTAGHDDRERGRTDTYALPIHPGLNKKIGEIAEFYLRKAGDDGWLLAGALLFANGFDLPVLGNSRVNQFLDSGPEVLTIRDWSTRSLCSSSHLPATSPLIAPCHRLAGPVLGQLSDTTANVLYRVDREGRYRLTVDQVESGLPVWSEVQPLSPTARFCVTGLVPDTHYRFRLARLSNGQDLPEPEGGGEFRTSPPAGSGVRFRFAFGSCARSHYDVAQTAWTGIRELAANPARPPGNGVRFFVHLGDTFYFYDDVIGQEPKNLGTVLAAHVSQRRHRGFLEMARLVPCVAIWDDHDFRYGNGQSTNYPARSASLQGFLDYWGNDPLDPKVFGLTTLHSYGNVDLYLLDGRYYRHRSQGICFTNGLLDHVLACIDQRGHDAGKLVIVASGSTWNHTKKNGEAYGNGVYDQERERFFERLSDRLGGAIQGLVFLSGDIHRNEIYEIVLAGAGRRGRRVAPELVCSPLGKNSALKSSASALAGERKWSVPSKGPHARRGFATLDVDTTSTRPDGNWTIQVNYHDAHAASTAPYHVRKYLLNEGQFA